MLKHFLRKVWVEEEWLALWRFLMIVIEWNIKRNYAKTDISIETITFQALYLDELQTKPDQPQNVYYPQQELCVHR